jgi:hypothetical protein
MPEFYRVSFDADELEALRRACALQSDREDKLLGEAASGSLEGVVMQESRADDMLLIKSTVSVFKPGQTILITKEDLLLIKKCLESLKDAGPAKNAIDKIDGALQHAPH